MAATQPVLEVSLEPKIDSAMQPADPMLAMIERLVTDKSADVEKLERLMQMHERVTARNAEVLFNTAMSEAQTGMRPVATDADNPQTRSRYASYRALDRALRPIYTSHGFGLSFDTTDSPLAEHVRILCYVTHAGGHARTYKADMPADGKGAKGGDVMTKTHAAGSAMSYGMRYLLKMIFNVAVGDEDDDGNQADGKSEIVSPDGFQSWLDDMDAMMTGGANWDRYKEAWNGSPEPFRVHLAKMKNGRIDQWKKLAGKAVKRG